MRRQTSTLANALNYLARPTSFTGLASAVPAVNGATLPGRSPRDSSVSLSRFSRHKQRRGEFRVARADHEQSLCLCITLGSPACTNTYFMVVRAVDTSVTATGNTVEHPSSRLPTRWYFLEG